MIKGMWKSKDEILLMFLIGQTLVLSVSAELCYRCPMILWTVSVTYIATTVAPACDTLMPSTSLSSSVFTTGAIVQHNYALMQQPYHCSRKLVCSKPVTFRFAADYFCFLLLFVFCLVMPVNCSTFCFVVWHHDKNNLTLKILSRAIKIAKVTCSSWASVTKPADDALAG